MAYKRKRSTTATTGRRVKRRTARPMRSLRMASSTFYVKQKSFLEQWQFSTAAVTGFWRYYTTTAGAMYNFTQHAAVFDEYKITNVTFEFRPQWDNFSPDNSLWSSGNIHTINDPKSTLVPSGAFSSGTLNSFLEQGNVKSRRFGTVVALSFKPAIAKQIYGGGLSGVMSSAPWIKTSEASVEHRGFHVYLQQNDATLLPVKYDVFVTYTIMFRGHR